MIRQEWHDLLFANWPVPAPLLAARVPAPLELDTYEGSGWVSMTPFLLRGLRLPGLPSAAGLDFPELNVRTYVRYRERSGIYFFSLDAGSAAAVAGARTFFRLPYFHADMEASWQDDWLHYRSRRREGEAELLARYRPLGEARHPEPATLEHWLAERYSLFTVLRRGTVLQVDVRHPSWTLRDADAVLERNTMIAAAGLETTGEPTIFWGGFVDVTATAPKLAA